MFMTRKEDLLMGFEPYNKKGKLVQMILNKYNLCGSDIVKQFGHDTGATSCIV